MKNYFRTPRNYDGAASTTRQLSDVIPHVLEKINDQFIDRPDLVLAAWPDIIGPRLAPMTQAVSFQHGILTVKVKSSTLYNLLCQSDKHKLLHALCLKFPKTEIKRILFRIG